MNRVGALISCPSTGPPGQPCAPPSPIRIGPTSRPWTVNVGGFKPKQQLDHVSNGNTLKALLAEHGEMSMQEARERGLEDGPLLDDVEYEEADYEADDDPEPLDEFDEDGRRVPSHHDKPARPERPPRGQRLAEGSAAARPYPGLTSVPLQFISSTR